MDVADAILDYVEVGSQSDRLDDCIVTVPVNIIKVRAIGRIEDLLGEEDTTICLPAVVGKSVGGGIRRAVMRILFCVAVAALVAVPRALAVELFWNDDVGIHRVRPGDPVGLALFETFETRGIAVDVAGNRLLWSDILPLGAPLPGGVIRSGGPHGGEITNVVRDLTSPAGVALDSDRGKIYWTDLGDIEHPSAVFSSNLDGADAKQLISGQWLSEITGIAVDSQHASLYFTYVNPLLDSLYNGGIARADLDGSNVEAIVDGLVKPLGIAIDSQGGNIYWAHARGLGGELDGAIEAADLDRTAAMDAVGRSGDAVRCGTRPGRAEHLLDGHVKRQDPAHYDVRDPALF